MSNITPPLPKITSSGSLYATEKECQWWLDSDVGVEQMKAVDKAEKRGEHPHKNQISANNQQWVQAARKHLKDYVAVNRPLNGGHRTSGTHDGLISEALTRIRDDKVVHQSISGIDTGTQEGLELGHQDVLAAVALLSRLDRTKGEGRTFFRPEAFQSDTSKVA